MVGVEDVQFFDVGGVSEGAGLGLGEGTHSLPLDAKTGSMGSPTDLGPDRRRGRLEGRWKEQDCGATFPGIPPPGGIYLCGRKMACYGSAYTIYHTFCVLIGALSESTSLVELLNEGGPAGCRASVFCLLFNRTRWNITTMPSLFRSGSAS